jgi:hypothetical protein
VKQENRGKQQKRIRFAQTRKRKKKKKKDPFFAHFGSKQKGNHTSCTKKMGNQATKARYVPVSSGAVSGSAPCACSIKPKKQQTVAKTRTENILVTNQVVPQTSYCLKVPDIASDVGICTLNGSGRDGTRDCASSGDCVSKCATRLVTTKVENAKNNKSEFENALETHAQTTCDALPRGNGCAMIYVSAFGQQSLTSATGIYSCNTQKGM